MDTDCRKYAERLSSVITTLMNIDDELKKLSELVDAEFNLMNECGACFSEVSGFVNVIFKQQHEIENKLAIVLNEVRMG